MHSFGREKEALMRKLALGVVVAATLFTAAVPAMAQVGFYAGPGGVGVGVGGFGVGVGDPYYWGGHYYGAPGTYDYYGAPPAYDYYGAPRAYVAPRAGVRVAPRAGVRHYRRYR
jgi:hypothetical protein